MLEDKQGNKIKAMRQKQQHPQDFRSKLLKSCWICKLFEGKGTGCYCHEVRKYKKC